MGWCSATEIMDTTVRAVDELLTKAYDWLGVDENRVRLADIQPQLDEALKPFVAAVAKQLRSDDWDCIEESDYFDRFPQEMLGLDDREMETWYRERLAESDDPTAVREYSTRLAALLERD